MIEPLELQTWVVNVFAGDATYFAAIAVLALTALAAYFRMSMLGMFLMIGVFILMFSGFVPLSLTILIAIVGGLLIGYWVSRIMKN